jgi:hypothetical protein
MEGIFTMKNTFKLLTLALICTVASQSFGMSRLFSRLSKAGTRIATHAKTQLASARTKVAQSATMARLMATKPAARRMVYGGAAGIASVASVASASGAVAGSTSTVESQKAVALIQAGSRAPQKEWTPEEMQAKLNALKAVEEASSEAAKEEAFAKAQPYPVMEYNVEGVYTVHTLEELGRLQFMKNHAALFAKCMAREQTDRSKFPESDNKQANECADLWKKAYGLMNSQKNVPVYDERHFTFRRLLKGMVFNEDVFEKTNMVELPVKNGKVETTLDIYSADTVDLKKLAEEGHSAQFKVGERSILPYTAAYEIFPMLREKRYWSDSGLKCDLAPTLATFSYRTPIKFGNVVVNKAEGKMSIEDPSKVVHVCTHGSSNTPCQECTK